MRIDQLTFTRFIAAISIVIFHYGEFIPPFNHPAISYLFRNANLGVNYFFVLSGFVMILAYGKHTQLSAIEYLKNRFARVYPVYLFAILLLLLYMIAGSNPIDYTGLVLNITLLQAWVPGKAFSFNYPGWSLSVEALFYLAFPFLVNKVYSQYKYSTLLLPFAILWLCTQLLAEYAIHSTFYQGFGTPSHDAIYHFPLMHINEFLLGNLAGYYFINKLHNKARTTDLYILAIGIFIAIVLMFNIGMNYHNGLLSIVFIPIILLYAVNNGVITKLSSLPVCIFLGEISYGVYILQWPVFAWVRGIFRHYNIQHNELYFYTSFFTLIALSALSYTYIETPLRKYIKSRSINL